MRLATLADGTPDGSLVLASRDGTRCLKAPVSNLLNAIENWDVLEPQLAALAERVEAGEGEALDPARLLAPLPRTWQWLDGSAFGTHGHLMQIAFGLPPVESERPLMYQGMSDRFYAGSADIPFLDEADGIDFEGEFGVILDAVPMGVTPEEAAGHIKLVVQINDWSLRAIAPAEMKTGFGWVQAKPACSMAPFAVSPDALGAQWTDTGRVALDLVVERSGQPFGHANGAAMDVGFPELVAHAARTRDLVAGTIIGSGTVSSPDYEQVGSSCISEVRAIEMIASGAASSPFLQFGEEVFMEARTRDGWAPFGTIRQKVVPA
ncbi:fumarylacetoacetate hydrolase family protein [Novosphingobium mangrovi (ex Hu et al. 2023)]|uniref:Fumarylacetoacetate hydrolase family protein n=1 Tax=Novosphingobium mangrovi (ex Hu et al. 2023) TaxID=2930094 RepID=A0ABT0A7V7_9SPHN|nr:fumarylacetoacetate hydrolase family protein [Novosphingobium mangrovi (ex Hu et al. 2023)]MCJ1959257.1 fumarylacetoacetate hydrolase family protein [Novosphingobium mangrovi (ex Hu et al. 2023)]